MPPTRGVRRRRSAVPAKTRRNGEPASIAGTSNFRSSRAEPLRRRLKTPPKTGALITDRCSRAGRVVGDGAHRAVAARRDNHRALVVRERHPIFQLFHIRNVQHGRYGQPRAGRRRRHARQGAVRPASPSIEYQHNPARKPHHDDPLSSLAPKRVMSRRAYARGPSYRAVDEHNGLGASASFRPWVRVRPYPRPVVQSAQITWRLAPRLGWRPCNLE